MELFRRLRLFEGNRRLRKRASKLQRFRRFINISEAKTIGILWDIENVDDLSPISDFMFQMSERGIKTDILGFFGEKELPDKLTALRYLNCLKREDYSYLYMPKTKESEHFIKPGFDILIEICFRDVFPLRYVSALSESKFKIGPGFNG
ncbi:MAG: hypothetical protein R6W67_01765, partial [Bacteroidales bacterium]